jgi:hypothetical protein
MKGQVAYNSGATDRERARIPNNNLNGNVANKEKRFKYDKVGYFEMQSEDSWRIRSQITEKY